MNRQNLFQLLYVILIVALLLFIFFTYNYMKSNAIECLQNPKEYFEEKNDMECSCFGGGIGFNQPYSLDG